MVQARASPPWSSAVNAAISSLSRVKSNNCKSQALIITFQKPQKTKLYWWKSKPPNLTWDAPSTPTSEWRPDLVAEEISAAPVQRKKPISISISHQLIHDKSEKRAWNNFWWRKWCDSYWILPVNQSINQSINQSNNQSNNKSINQSINQRVDRPDDLCDENKGKWIVKTYVSRSLLMLVGNLLDNRVLQRRRIIPAAGSLRAIFAAKGRVSHNHHALGLAKVNQLLVLQISVHFDLMAWRRHRAVVENALHLLDVEVGQADVLGLPGLVHLFQSLKKRETSVIAQWKIQRKWKNLSSLLCNAKNCDK